MSMIETKPIAGAAVYGVEQMDYTVDGVSGRDYAAAVTAAAFKESVAIEYALNAYAETVRQRSRKVEDLGDLMSHLNAAVANLKVKDSEPGDTASVPGSATAIAIAQKYGISGVSSTMRRDTLYRTQNEVQYAMDREDNDLKQDMVSLQSCMSKRDNAFSSAAKLVKKSLEAASGTIKNIGA